MDDIVLSTERLILRPLVMADLDALAEIYSDPEVRRFFPEGTLTREETREELEWIIDVYYARYGYGLWATVLKETGAFIGRCGLLPWKIVAGQGGRPGLDGADESPMRARGSRWRSPICSHRSTGDAGSPPRPPGPSPPSPSNSSI